MFASYKSSLLLFGMPRSGTTWIGKVFDSHPRTFYMHEPDSFQMLDGIPLVVERNDYPKYTELFTQCLDSLETIRSVRVVGKLPVFAKDSRSAPGNCFHKYALMTIKAIARAGFELNVPEFNNSRTNDETLVWKSIESLGRLGLALNLLDNVRGMHIVRHPCGYIASVKRGAQEHRFGSEVPASEDYGLFELLLETAVAKRHGLEIEALRQMSDVERLAWRWLIFNESAFNACSVSEQYRLVNYEAVCADPVSHYRALFDFAGLAWSTQTEKFLGHTISSDDSAYYSVVRNPLDAANAWKRQLSECEIGQVEAVVTKSDVGAFRDYEYR